MIRREEVPIMYVTLEVLRETEPNLARRRDVGMRIFLIAVIPAAMSLVFRFHRAGGFRVLCFEPVDLNFY
jgi:hypothetical protein